jgi:hypothetical protein
MHPPTRAEFVLREIGKPVVEVAGFGRLCGEVFCEQDNKGGKENTIFHTAKIEVADTGQSHPLRYKSYLSDKNPNLRPVFFEFK